MVVARTGYLGRTVDEPVQSPGHWLESKEGWEKLPPHPGRAIKPAPGRNEGAPNIWRLTAFDDEHVFISHGDWDKNDGATMLVSLNPKTREYTNHGIHDTEAFDDTRILNGRIYLPYMDPTGYWDQAYPFAVYPPFDHEMTKTDGLHFFDVAEVDGTLFVTGSALRDDVSYAAVNVSSDQGRTWSLEFPTPASGDVSVSRSYQIEAVNGTVYAKALTKWYKRLGPNQWELDETFVPPPIPEQQYTGGTVWEEPQALARTSTHWVTGDRFGDIYIKPLTPWRT